MLFVTAILRAACEGRRRSVIIGVPVALLALALVIGAIAVRDLTSAHMLTATHTTGSVGAGRQGDLVARAVAAWGAETALFALIAGLLAAVLTTAAPVVTIAVGATAAGGGAVVARTAARAPESQRTLRSGPANIQIPWRCPR